MLHAIRNIEAPRARFMGCNYYNCLADGKRLTFDCETGTSFVGNSFFQPSQYGAYDRDDYT
jgi:hypothetical protein